MGWGSGNLNGDGKGEGSRLHPVPVEVLIEHVPEVLLYVLPHVLGKLVDAAGLVEESREQRDRHLVVRAVALKQPPTISSEFRCNVFRCYGNLN